MPASRRAALRRVLDALEAVLPVRIEGRSWGDWHALTAIVAVGEPPAPSLDPRLAGVPVLRTPSSPAQVEDAPEGWVEFAFSDHLDPHLRGRRLRERGAHALRTGTSSSRTVLARGPGGPVWSVEGGTRAPVHHVAVPMSELGAGERLKDHLTPGRCMGLLPVLHLLRRVAGEDGWRRPPLHACIVIDDPNLHRPSYGYVRYSDLAARARDGGYHVAVAVVPLDLAYAHADAVEVFRRSLDLSLLVHGNDHVRMELARPRSVAEATALAAQALLRVERFEARHRLHVARVMAPPHDGHGQPTAGGLCPTHGPCSALTMSAMLRVGFDAVCYCGPLRDTAGWITSGWQPADMHIGDGLPGLPRGPLAAPADELVLRAVLGQPIILFGHHQDIGGDPDILDDTAAKIDRLGHVVWTSPQQIARRNVAVRERDDVIEVRPFSRRFRIEGSHATRGLVVRMPESPQVLRWLVVREGDGIGGGRRIPLGEPAALPAAGLEVSIEADGGAHPHGVSSPRWRAWPVVRRCLTEARDRLQPALSRRA